MLSVKLAEDCLLLTNHPLQFSHAVPQPLGVNVHASCFDLLDDRRGRHQQLDEQASESRLFLKLLTELVVDLMSVTDVIGIVEGEISQRNLQDLLRFRVHHALIDVSSEECLA
jgi:hypothetical protein